ncbi:type II secretion system F family protein [Plebeiibacterium sediminum]|uniref:General secretion pathway protein F n=1 Tax=Plebeiibacterium sediminum TaxID=2992112 RepID=A0AAE3M6X5_9BACT|nr:type II secretion system F family protein [Plebeiobacterium sediminum]MCW3787899.1 type II secretion system F family protein [Plebeiobacterium sediminum]
MAIDLSQIKNYNQQVSPGKLPSKEDLPFWKKEISFGKILTDKIKEVFYSELVILMTAGLDLKLALDLIVQEEKKEKVKNIYYLISQKILHGLSLSEAIKDQPEFGQYEFYSIKIGEESGSLVLVLEELSLFFRKKVKQKKQIISAISYPAMIFITALGAVFFMMNFIVPLFADAFKRFNSDLPTLTKAVIYLSDQFRNYWYLIPISVGLIVVLVRMFRNEEWYRKYSGILLLRIPVIGKLMQKIYLASFCQSMSLMTSAKTPLVQSLELVSKMIGLYPYEKALISIREGLYHGKPLNELMLDYPIFDSRMVSLIKVGEETNRLDSIFKRLYDQYTEETDHQTTVMSSLLEPMLIIVVGGMVALLLVAMYLPMFKLGGSLMN